VYASSQPTAWRMCGMAIPVGRMKMGELKRIRRQTRPTIHHSCGPGCRGVHALTTTMLCWASRTAGASHLSPQFILAFWMACPGHSPFPCILRAPPCPGSPTSRPLSPSFFLWVFVPFSSLPRSFLLSSLRSRRVHLQGWPATQIPRPTPCPRT
jgi:hypothetical protein